MNGDKPMVTTRAGELLSNFSQRVDPWISRSLAARGIEEDLRFRAEGAE